MKQLLSTRRLIKAWHKREKATIDHLVGALSAIWSDLRIEKSAAARDVTYATV